VAVPGPATPSTPTGWDLVRVLVLEEDDGSVPARSPPAETVEFTVSRASEERAPFDRRKLQNQTLGVPAVADTDPAIGQVRYFDAVAVSET
jgi:hypothetical protein